jgi:competence protein ComEA
MKKILFFMSITISFLFSAVNLQLASKDELMCIKGIGTKKADAIIQYRKSNKLKSADDLLNIKGFGKVLVDKVKKGEQTVKCSGKKSNKPVESSKKVSKKKIDKKEETSTIEKKSEEKKKSTKIDKK